MDLNSFSPLSLMNMDLQCACPLGAALATPTAPTCKEDIGEIRRIILQRTLDGTTLNTIVIGTDDPTLLATWTALQGAAGNTKIAALATMAEVTPDGGGPREAGTGPGGVTLYKGALPTSYSAQFQQIEQDVIRSYRAYQCEPRLSAWLVNENDQIIGLKDATVATTFRGIPLESLYIGPKFTGGLNQVDYNMINWSFLGEWSDFLHVVTPVFSPLLEL